MKALNSAVQSELMNQYEAVDRFDVVDAAEKRAGTTHHLFNEDQALNMLGTAAAQSQLRTTLLTSMKDVHSRMTLNEYIDTLISLGFTLIYSEPVDYIDHEGKDRRETFFMFGQEEHGIVLQFDSYTWGDDALSSVNGGEWYAVWSPRPELVGAPERHHYTSSGCWESPSVPNWRRSSGETPSDVVWVGYWDAREGLRYRITRLLEGGSFAASWPRLDRLPHGLFRSAYDYHNPGYLKLTQTKQYQASYAFTDSLSGARKARVLESNPDLITKIVGAQNL